MKVVKFGLAVVATMLYLSAANAQVDDPANRLAYEGFEGTPGATLETAAGSSGYGWRERVEGAGTIDAWGVRNSNQGPGTQTVVAGSLGYTDTAGNQLVVAGNHARAYNETGNSQYFRHIDHGGAYNQSLSNFVGQGNAYYISFIGERQGVTDSTYIGGPDPTPTNEYSRNAQLNFITPPSGEGGNNGGNTGELGNIDEQNDFWHFRVEQTDVQSTVPFSYNQQFIVAKISVGGGILGADRVEVFFDPILSGEGLNTPGIVADAFKDSLPYTLNQTGLGIWTGGGNSNRAPADMIFDEIRVGTTWLSVTPHQAIPEPGTVVLLGLGGVALVAARRLRK